MKKFIDIESNEIITEEQLYIEYIEAKNELPLEIWYSFSDYINNCLTKNNGTLEIIK